MTVLKDFNYGKTRGSLNNLEIVPIIPPENLKDFLTVYREKNKLNLTTEFQSLVMGAEIAIEVEPENHKVIPFDLACLSIEGQVCSAQIGNFFCSQVGTEYKFIDNPLFDRSIKEHLLVYAITDMITNQPNMLSPLGHNIFAYRAGEKYNKQSVIQKRSDLGLRTIPWHYFEDHYRTQSFHVTGEKLFFPINKSAL